jgi:hypothetical protein
MMRRKDKEGLRLSLRLGDIQDLFAKQDLSPLSDDYQEYSYISGIEFIANELYAHPSYAAVKVTILLPGSSIDPGLEDRAKNAVKRYCWGRLKDVGHDISASYWRGVRSLMLAFVALFVFTGASILVYSESYVFLQIISEGLAIAAWVILWLPIQMLTFTVWDYRLDRKVYNTLKDMELVIQPVD